MPDGGKLEEIYRLTKENNQMLRAMRRSARLHALFKVAFYVGIALVAGWVYLTYVAPLLLQMLEALNKVQGMSSQAQGQIGAITEQLEKLRAFIPLPASNSSH